jgi:hypothetical protein
MELAHWKRRIRDGLLNIRRLDERKVLLDLLQRPARADQAEHMFRSEPVPASARLAAHLALPYRPPKPG